MTKLKILQVLVDPGDKIGCPNKSRERGRCNLFSLAKTNATIKERYESRGGQRIVWQRKYRCGAGHEFLVTWVVDPEGGAKV